MSYVPLTVNQGALNLRCNYEHGGCLIHICITNDGFDKNKYAEFDNDYITLRVRKTGKRWQSKPVKIVDFVKEPGQMRDGIHRGGVYELLVKQTCFDWFAANRFPDNPNTPVVPKTNLCVHPNPHHKVVPTEGVTAIYQGGKVNPR